MHNALPSPSDPDHSTQAGRACHDDGEGCCRECGVALVSCESCGGVGYHADECVDAEPAS